MKINKQTLFSIIFICFALIGKSMSHDKQTTETPSSSPTIETPSSSPTTETPSSSPTTETPSSSPTTETPSSLPMTETPSSLPTTETPSSLPTTETPSSLPTTETPSSLPTTETPSSSSPTSTPSTSSPASSPSSSVTDEVSDTLSIDPPSDSPAPTPDSDASSDSLSTSTSFSHILKEKYIDQPKTEYSPALQKICGHTHHIDVCLATISTFIKNKNKFDAIQVLEASIKVSKENIKDIVEKIEKEAKESRENAASLNDCKEHYSKALESLHKALEAIRAKNFGKVTILLSGALADVSTAESKVVDLQIPNFKVESFSFASVTASNCLSIASLVPN